MNMEPNETTLRPSDRASLTTWEWVLLLAPVLLAAIARGLTFPLGTDVDTGTFMMLVRAMADGHQLYADIPCNHTPLLFCLGRILYALSPAHFVAITKIAMILLSASVTVPIFLIGRVFFGRWAAFAAALFFAVDPLSLFYARQLHLSVLEAVTATWAMWLMVAALRAKEHRPVAVFLAGIGAALAFMNKQSSGILWGLYPVLALLFSSELAFVPSLKRAARDMRFFIPALLLVSGLTVLIIAWAGVLDGFWGGVIGYHLHMRESGTQAASVGTWLAKVERCKLIAAANPWLCLFALFGVVHGAWRREVRTALPVLWIAFLAAFLFLFYYENGDHYFLTWAAPASLLAGYGLTRLIELVREDVTRERLAPSTRAMLGILSALLLAFGAKFIQLRRMEYAALALVPAAGIWARILMNSAPSPEGRGRSSRLGRKAACAALAALTVALVCLSYCGRRGAYPEPYLPAAAEKTMAQWVRSRVLPGEDVANIACNVLTIYGGWRDVPVVLNGKKRYSPMLVADALREWSPRPEFLKDTISLWEREYHVRFLLIYDDAWHSLRAPQNKPLADYLNGHFSLAREFDWDSGDYYGHLRVYERSSPRKPEAANLQGEDEVAAR